MATRTASWNEAPTNMNIFDRAVRTLTILLLNMAEIRVTSQRYVHLFPNIGNMMQPTMSSRRVSLFDYTFTELLFCGSDMVNTASILVLLVISFNLNWNWGDGDEARRPINLYYRTCMRSIFLVTVFLCLVRYTVIHSEDEVFVWMLVGTLILMAVAGLGWLIWSVLRSVKGRYMK